MATRTLIGGPQLKARLEAMKAVPAGFAEQWADDAKSRIKQTHPPAKREASRRFSTKVDGLRAAVYGAFWWVFVDRGTKAHDIKGEGADNPPNVLKFKAGGLTIFAKKVRHPRTQRRPFITNAAKDALSASRFSDLVVQSWNRKRIGKRGRFL